MRNQTVLQNTDATKYRCRKILYINMFLQLLVPRSCSEWRRNGYTQTGMYLIDPDGLDGVAPFSVECRMLHPEGAITVVHHDHQGRNRVVGHEEPGSLQVIISYPGMLVFNYIMTN